MVFSALAVEPGHLVSAVSVIPLMGHLGALASDSVAFVFEKKVDQIHWSSFKTRAGRAKHATQSIFVLLSVLLFKNPS